MFFFVFVSFGFVFFSFCYYLLVARVARAEVPVGQDVVLDVLGRRVLVLALGNLEEVGEHLDVARVHVLDAVQRLVVRDGDVVRDGLDVFVVELVCRLVEEVALRLGVGRVALGRHTWAGSCC